MAVLAAVALVAPPVQAAEGAAAAPGAEGPELIVAFDESPTASPHPGGTPRAGYSALAAYAGGASTRAQAAAVLQDFGLQEQAAWTIDVLRLRCLRVRAAPGVAAPDLLARLSADPRVRLAQPVQQFETYGTGTSPAPAVAPAATTPAAAAPAASSGLRYDDPYLGLQRGFAQINAGAAHGITRGDGVRVALIDTAVDTSHPDLAGRVAAARNFVGAAAGPAPAAGGERHATELAGVIAAVPNNRIGIAGIAPQAQLVSYRACWPVRADGSSPARCDSFTLARALGAAIGDGSDVINLSLGGPADPLLQRLLDVALQRGAIVVGALPPGGVRQGFPTGVAGVLAAASNEPAPAGAPPTISAPGRDILTLAPGGGYDYASGSSLAAAHLSGAVALLRALQPGLRAGDVAALLAPASDGGPGIDLCTALGRLRPENRCALR